MKILFINREKKYGGSVYEDKAKKAISKGFNIEQINYSSKKDFFLKNWKASKRKDISLVVKTFDASLFVSPKPIKNIAIVHHIDYSFAPFLIKGASFFLDPITMGNLKKFDKIVVVSKYWQEFFEKKGYKNVYLIYNAFDLTKFNISDEEVEEFKKRYNLEKKPIIYLGNCQKAKGVVESYESLKDLDTYLITSGKEMVKIPAINLNLSHRDYLKLLKASSIAITMSKFKEGWNITAHEAMLMRTPVIGSGKGGMRELLEGGKQIICPDFNCLKEKVKYLLENPQKKKEIGENGYNFAKNFTIDKFNNEWLKLIKELLNEK